MKNKKQIELNEIDLKCITEMNLLVDVMSSTLNKIGLILQEYYNDLKPEFNNLQNNWLVNEKESFNIRFFPFSYSTGKKIEITELDNYLYIESAFQLQKLNNEKKNDFFWFYFGYCINNDSSKDNYVYFIFNKPHLINKNSESNLYDIDFYKNLIGDSKYEVQLGDSDDETNYEYIEIVLDEISVDKMNEYYEYYKNKIVIPIIQNLK